MTCILLEWMIVNRFCNEFINEYYMILKWFWWNEWLLDHPLNVSAFSQTLRKGSGLHPLLFYSERGILYYSTPGKESFTILLRCSPRSHSPRSYKGTIYIYIYIYTHYIIYRRYIYIYIYISYHSIALEVIVKKMSSKSNRASGRLEFEIASLIDTLMSVRAK